MVDSDLDRVLCDRAILNTLEDGLLATNSEHKIFWYNQALIRILAIHQQEEINGVDVCSLFDRYLLPTLDDCTSTDQLNQTLNNGGELPAFLCRVRAPNGARRWLSIASIPIPSSTGDRLIRVRDLTGDRDAHHFKLAISQSPVVTFAQDEDLRYIWSYNQQLGQTDTSIIGKKDDEVFPENAAHLTMLKRQVLESGKPVRATVTFTFGDDARVRDLTLKPLWDENGRIIGVTGIASDVTERNRMEEALREKTLELKKRMDELQCLYTIAHLVEVPGMTLDGLLQAVADTLPSGWQYPNETAVRIRVDDREYWRGDSRNTRWKQVSPIIVRGERLGEVEVRYLGEIPEVDGSPFLPEEQMLLDAIAERLGRIIERLQAEAALQESEEKFRGIAQRSFDLIVTSYLQGGLNYISPATGRILGYSPEEMTGTEWEDYVLPSSLPEWEKGRQRVLQGEQVERLKISSRRKDGETAILELNISPIFEEGTVVGFQAIGRDMSERILYEQIRERAFDMTERNIAQFAVLADHVRHPLQVIMGIADLLDDEKTAEKLREQVRRINEQIGELDREWMESRKIREFLKRYEL